MNNLTLCIRTATKKKEATSHFDVYMCVCFIEFMFQKLKSTDLGLHRIPYT